MKNKSTNRPAKSLCKRQHKDTDFRSQERTIFHYLQTHVATASMVSAATGIPQKNITRYKRDLEKAGLLWEVEKKSCKKTGFRAFYLTTNPDLRPAIVEPLKNNSHE